MSGRTVRARSCKKRSFSPEPIQQSFDTPPKRKIKLKKSPVGKRKSTIEKHSEGVKSKEAPLTESNGAKEIISIGDTSQESVGKLDDNETPKGEFIQRDTWPLKYSPCNFGKYVGNTAAVDQLRKWLEEWKEPAKRNISPDFMESNSSSCSSSETQSNAIFIRGPPGVGKTSLVYFLANQLGYKVLEMNSSSERSGRRVMADLQEATQSRHVEGTRVSSGGLSSFFKPTLSTTPISKVSSPSSQKMKKKPKSLKKPVIPVGNLKNFFSPSSKALPEPIEEEKTEPPKSSIKSFFARSEPTKNKKESMSPEIQTSQKPKDVPKQEDSQKIKCSNATIILFDDVDVVFDDEGDEGFWMALETVVKSSKKPCILTATRGYGSVLKRCKILQTAPVIELHRPSPKQVANLIRDICDAENRDLTDYNVEFMCQYLSSDVRRSLLQMEYETVTSGLLQTVYPANRTFGGLMNSGYLEDAMSLQSSFRRVGFNTAYASLEDCLPFEFENITVTGVSDIKEEVRRSGDRQTLRDLSNVFEQFAFCDVFTGCLDRLGEECLPSYERAKRWMEHRPMESYDCNFRAIEEISDLSTTALIGSVATPLNAICERIATDECLDNKFPHVGNHLGFNEIHKQLKKLRLADLSLEDVLNQMTIRRSVAFDYLYALTEICTAEEKRKNSKSEMSRRRGRFFHYLQQNGLFVNSQQLQRMLTFWT